MNEPSETRQIVTDGPLVNSINGQVVFKYFNGSVPVTQPYVNSGEAAFTSACSADLKAAPITSVRPDGDSDTFLDGKSARPFQWTSRSAA